MLTILKRKLKKNLINLPGWRTKRRIVVIESDDWGAIRLPSEDMLQKLSDMGIDLGEDHYIRNDSLASETDLNRLFATLGSFKGSREKSPVITANAIMANPDFDRIKAGQFEKYHYERFIETLKKYPEHQGSFHLWKEGMKRGLFHPQFHGREHLHVHRWMRGLMDRESETAKVFEHRLYALCTTASTENRKSYMAAYELDGDEDLDFTLNAIAEGLRIFKTLFGYPSLSAIAPNYTWNREMEQIYYNGGVRYFQGSTVQRSPDPGNNGNTHIRRYTGQRNDLGQTYLVRNCRFEPASDPSNDWVDSCLSEIKTAFRWRKPAIIESHRVNFIGFINPANRDRNLKLLGQLLNRIIQTWPDAEFLSSDELGKVIFDMK